MHRTIIPFYFCYKAGSTDGKTILVEDYYNALAVAKVGISGGSLSNIDLEIPLTYDEISRNINNALYLKIEECERLGIDISDLGITKPSQFIKRNASEAFNATGLMNGGVKDERYSNRFYNDDERWRISLQQLLKTRHLFFSVNESHLSIIIMFNKHNVL